MITIRIGGLPIRIGAEPIQALIAQHMPGMGGGRPGAKMDLDERRVHILQKAFLLAAVPFIAARARKHGMQLPPAVCPKGQDYSVWAMGWFLGVLLQMTGGTVIDLDYAQLADGSVLVTGVAPAAAGTVVDAPVGAHPTALAAPGEHGGDGAGAAYPGPAAAAAPDDRGAGPDDRDEPVGSLVHPGPDGQRQDTLCETPAG